MSLVTKLSLQRGPISLMFVGHWKAISDIDTRDSVLSRRIVPNLSVSTARRWRWACMHLLPATALKVKSA